MVCSRAIYCASLNLWTAHGVCLLPLSAYLTSELFMHTPHIVSVRGAMNCATTNAFLVIENDHLEMVLVVQSLFKLIRHCFGLVRL